MSFVIPAKNEAPNLVPVIAEIEAVCARLAPFEIVVVDDGSSDETQSTLSNARATRPWLRVRRHVESCGKSAALLSGARAARAPIIVTMDADGQNDPQFVPAMVQAFEAAEVGLVVGQRLRRGDGAFKLWQSRLANMVRTAILNDETRDTGCGLKAVRREVFLRLPFFDGLHRFLPALVRREGCAIAYVDVIDRPRLAGQSHYGLFNRLWVGILDMLGVRWLLTRRARLPRLEDMD